MADYEIVALDTATPKLLAPASPDRGSINLLHVTGQISFTSATNTISNLSLTIGTNTQAWDADLDAIAALANTDGNFIVGNGSTWVVESGATARTSLGLTIGTDVQAYSANLGAIAGLAVTDGNIIVGNGSTWVAESGATARTSIGAGTMNDLVDDTTPQLGGALDGQGFDLNNLGVLFMTEQAAAEVDVAGKGQWWVKTATPNLPMFTDDAGTDFQLATLAGTETLTNKTISDASNTISLEGTNLKSTGEAGGSKFLREDGDGTCSWQAIPGGGDALTANPLSQFAATTSLQLAGVISDETGSGSLVFATSPTLVTPALGTPSSGTLTSCTGLPISTGVSGLGTGVATFLATPSSANLISAVTDETGTGSLVFATSPTLVTPALGTPASGTLTNCTSLPISTGVSGLGTGVATFLGTPSSANLASAVTDETGTGVLVFGTNPTLTGATMAGELALNTNCITIELTAGDTVAKGDVCYINASGQAKLIDADAVSSCDGQLVMAFEAITSTNSGTFAVFGIVGGFSSLTPGTVYYASLTGTTGNTATTTKPSATGDVVRKIYTVMTSTTVFFNPSPDYGSIP